MPRQTRFGCFVRQSLAEALNNEVVAAHARALAYTVHNHFFVSYAAAESLVVLSTSKPRGSIAQRSGSVGGGCDVRHARGDEDQL